LVYASSYVDDVLILNRATGKQVGAFALRGYPVRIANDRTDRLFFATEKGLVLCLRERERDYPLFHKQPEKRPVEPEIAPEDGAKSKTPAKKAAAKKGEDAEEAPDANAAPAKTPAKKPTPAKKAPKSTTKKPAAD
jgi:hypothetical protein